MTGDLIGRGRELAEMLAGLDAVGDGGGRLFLLEGEPGIGKTQLANAVADEASGRGFAVAWGRCWEEGGAPAFWPWTQVLRAVLRGRAPAVPSRNTTLPRLVPIVPELRGVLGDDAAEAGEEAAPGQFALFDAVVTTLHQTAAEQPLMVVVDDLHAADLDSLQLLQFLAHELPRSGILVVGGYRADDASRSGTEGLLAKIARDGRTLPVRGLAEPEVAALVAHIAGRPADAGIVHEVMRATGGNPLHVDSITQLLVAEQRLHDSAAGHGLAATSGLPLPQSMIAAARSRVDYLDAPTRSLLQVAAVIGRTFTLPLLGAVTGRTSDDLVDALHLPTTRGTLRTSGSIPGGFVFEHILVRDALYRELEPSRRSELHWRVGVALELVHSGDLDHHAAELAHHFLLASGPGRDPRRAVDYSARAGQRALNQTAYEEAVAHFRRALDTLTAAGDVDQGRRCALLLALGSARMRSGDLGGGRATFLEAAAIARRLGRGDHLAEAALGYAGVTGYHFTGRPDATLISLIEEAIEVLPPGDSEMRVRLLARLSVALYWSELDARRLELSEEAVAMARRLGEPSTLAQAIHSRRYAQWGPDNFEQRLADATRCRELATAANDVELAVSASRWRFTDLLEDGDVAAADRELDAHGELAQRLHQPLLLGLTAQFRALRAIMQGRYADGERLADEARRDNERAGNPRAAFVYGSQLLPVWWQRDDREQLARFLDSMRVAPVLPATTSVMAFLHAAVGERETAAAIVDQLAAPGFHKFRHDMLFLSGLSRLAVACQLLGDAEHAERVYEVLLPYAGRIVIVGAPAQSCWGAVDHYLGVLAALGGHHEWAIGHLQAALTMSSRLGAPGLLAETRVELGTLLLRSEATRSRAEQMLAAAGRTAAGLGLQRLVDTLAARAASVAQTVAAESSPVPVRTDAPPPCTLRSDGDYWTVTTSRGSVHVRDSKGMRHLAALLAQPGRAVHVLDLAGAGVGGRAATGPAEADDGFVIGFGDAGAVLDETAKGAYRRRLAELDEQIDEAERFNDIERAAKLSAERGMFVDQLAQAVGLGGRDRRAVSVSERARVNVTRAIRSAIRRIGELDQHAGAYLDTTVVTGAHCVYEPHRAIVPFE